MEIVYGLKVNIVVRMSMKVSLSRLNLQLRILPQEKTRNKTFDEGIKYKIGSEILTQSDISIMITLLCPIKIDLYIVTIPFSSFE